MNAIYPMIKVYEGKSTDLDDLNFGDYPAEYKPEVHGPYDPARYYGKPDTPIDQVKLRDLPSWLSRRNYSPLAMGRCFGRFVWRVNHKYWLTKQYSGVYIMMLITCGQIIYFVDNNFKEAPHVHAKYH